MDASDSIFFLLIDLLHLFGAVVWLGSALVMGGAATPIQDYYSRPEHADPRAVQVVGEIERKMAGLNWMALTSLLLGGLLRTALMSDFQWFAIDGTPALVIHLKSLLFLVVIVGNARMMSAYRRLQALESSEAEENKASSQEPAGEVRRRIRAIRRLNVFLAFALLILIAVR